MDRIDEWKVFVAVAARRSFSGAARALGRSPQAATRAVAALEARLGTRLLNRTTRSVSLTDDGERYLERARGAVAELDRLESRADADAPLAGRLSVTSSVLFGQMHVLPVVVEMLAAHPDLDVRLVLLDRVVSLSEEGLDVGVRIGALPDSALRARVVGHVRRVLCASPAYLSRAGVPRTAAALARHTCVGYGSTSPILERWTFGGRAIAVRSRLVVNTSQGAIDAALAGVGIARALSYQVARLVAEGKLRLVLPALERDPIPVQLVHLPGVQTRAASAFIALAAARLRERLVPVTSRGRWPGAA